MREENNEQLAMRLSRQQRALLELVAMDLRFALLREPLCWEKAGDIDIVVQNIHETDMALKALGYQQFSRHESSHKYLRYDWAAEKWIHLDVQMKLFFGAVEPPCLFTESLLQRSQLGDDGIPRLDVGDETILWIFHVALDKGYIDPYYESNVLTCDPALMSRLADEYAFLPRPLGEYVELIEALRKGRSSEKKVIRKIQRSLGHPVCKTPPLSLRAYRRIRHMLRGPQPVVFLGPDGSGKSFVTKRLAMLRWPPLRCQYMGPARESEMHMVFTVPMKALARLRERYSRRHPIGIFARAGWQIICYIDYWDRVIRHMYFQGSGGVVIFDRYACDMYFRKATWWNEFLFVRMFVRPQFVFLCVGDVGAIHKRKPELPPEQIERTIELYRKKLAQYRIDYKEINTTTHLPDEVLDQVTRYLIDKNWFRRRW